MSQQDGEAGLDPIVMDEIDGALSDQDIIGGYARDGSENDKLPLVEKWFPGEDKYEGKTVITKQQARALALARHLPKAFPEITPMESFIKNVLDDYEILLTSVEGQSREQQMAVLRSMFGAGSEEGDAVRAGLLSQIIGGKEDNDD